jgi:DNA-binding NarL/FixJ family response regulator
VVAVDALSFDVRPGMVTGFLGPNGSGKSTTIGLMLGLDALDRGAARIARRRFTAAVTRVAAGGTALDSEVIRHLLAASRRAGGLDPLTARERDVLALMAEGRSNAGIATSLVLTLGTLEKRVASIFTKLSRPASETDNRRVLAVLRQLRS